MRLARPLFLTLISAIAWLPLGWSADEPNRAKLIIDDALAVQARIEIGESAQRELNIGYFILHEDEAGLLALAEARRTARRIGAEGKSVTVRLLVDGLAHRLSAGMIRHLRDEGIEIRVYQPVFVNEMHRKRSAVSKLQDIVHQLEAFDDKPVPVDWIWKRMHDKHIIADGARALTGSRNLQNGYFSDRRYSGFRSHDVDVIVEGPEVKFENDYFMALWESDHVKAFPDFAEVPANEVNHAAGKIDHFSKVLHRWRTSQHLGVRIKKALEGLIPVKSADFLDDSITAKGRETRVANDLLKFIDQAQFELVIENPYIILTRDFRKALKAAKKRGVRIIALTNSPETMDIELVGKMYRRERKDIANLGIEIYERSEKGMVHGKVMMADRKWISVSTYNLDPRSRNLNLEIGYNFESPELAATYLPRMEAFMSFNRKYDPKTDRLRIKSAADCLQYLWDSVKLTFLRSQL